jgi:hypothetical protein
MSSGGVPERSNGAVLKTVARRKACRGFESHPRRSKQANPPCLSRFEVLAAVVDDPRGLIFRVAFVGTDRA